MDAQNNSKRMRKGKGKKKASQATQTVSTARATTASVSYGVQSVYRGPKMQQTPRGTIVENCESLLLVSSPATIGDEGDSSIALSARSANLPWLRQIGELYQKYKFLDLKITYEPFCSTATGGQIVFAMVYDQNDSDVGNVNQDRLLQIGGNSRSPVWAPGSMVTYDKNRAAYPWFVSRANPQASTLANLSVPAWLLSSVTSSVNTGGLGRFMAHYRVEFIEPVSVLTNI